MKPALADIASAIGTTLEAGYLALSRVCDLASPKIHEYALSNAKAEPLIKEGLTRVRSPQDANDDTYAAVQMLDALWF